MLRQHHRMVHGRYMREYYNHEPDMRKGDPRYHRENKPRYRERRWNEDED